MMSIPGYITANVVSLFWSKIFYCLPMFVICAISTLCNISIHSFRLCPSTCCLTHFWGVENYTIFRSFGSFRKFRSIRLCPLDLCFDPFFWSWQILLFFAVFVIFTVSGYVLQTCCLTHFCGVDEFYIQDMDRLQRLQNRSARIITHCTRSSAAKEQLHWPTLSSRRSYHKAKLVFLCLHSLVPSYFSLYFTRFSNIHNYSTRQSMRLSLPKVKQNFGKRTFLFTGAKIFNELPLNIVKSDNIQTFCRRARHFFLL